MPSAHRAALLAVACGGAIGGLARWGLAEGLGAGAQDGAWPWGTLVANIAGALVLGAVAARLLHADPAHPRRRLGVRGGALLGPGFCGALTTFSTLQLEVVRLVRDGEAALGIAYLAVTLAAGLAMARAGFVAAGGRTPAGSA